MNTSSNIFSSKFVSALRAVLKSKCADGQRVTREEVCELLAKDGLVVSPEIIMLAIVEGAANTSTQAFSLFRGRWGGIREIDLEETKRIEAEIEKNRLRGLKAAETRKARKEAKAQDQAAAE